MKLKILSTGHDCAILYKYNDNIIHKSYEIDGCNVLSITPLTTITSNIIYDLKFLKSTYDLGFATTFHAQSNPIPA